MATHWIPPRDFNTSYAFEMEAVAGHRYRIPREPSSCLAPGNIDAALTSSSVYHTRLSVIERAPGSPGQRFDVEALCATARGYVCVPIESATDAPADGLNCVRLEGWSWCYYGKDTGPSRRSDRDEDRARRRAPLARPVAADREWQFGARPAQIGSKADLRQDRIGASKQSVKG